MKRLFLLAACLLLLSSARAETPVRIACGQTKPYTDSSGNVWAADADFNVGTAYATTHTVAGTPDSALYQNERYSTNDSPAMIYNIPAAAGNYTLNLYFSENYVAAANQRLFNVKVNGSAVLTNFDIYAAAGGQFKANQQSFNVTSTGTVTIEFDHASPAVQNPKIDAIALLPLPANISLAVTGSVTFDDGSTVYVGMINAWQSNGATSIPTGSIGSNVNGILTGTLSVNPTYIDANGNVTLQFSVPAIPSSIAQTFPIVEFQQGSTGLKITMVIFKAALLPKSFSVALTP